MLPLLPPIVPGNEASYCDRSHLNGEQRVGSLRSAAPGVTKMRFIH